jgi:hypothetical protein
MANLQARLADLATAQAALSTVIQNCHTDIAANDSDLEPIKRIQEQAQSAMQSLGFDAGDYGPPVT